MDYSRSIVNRYQAKLRYSINGCEGYVKTVTFTIWSNETVTVFNPEVGTLERTKTQAREYAKRLIDQGYKF